MRSHDLDVFPLGSSICWHLTICKARSIIEIMYQIDRNEINKLDTRLVDRALWKQASLKCHQSWSHLGNNTRSCVCSEKNSGRSCPIPHNMPQSLRLQHIRWQNVLAVFYPSVACAPDWKSTTSTCSAVLDLVLRYDQRCRFSTWRGLVFTSVSFVDWSIGYILYRFSRSYQQF